MGATRRTLGLLRVPGPATGLLTQPIVGTLIDMDRRASSALSSASSSLASSAAASPHSALLGGTSTTREQQQQQHVQQQQRQRRRWFTRLPFSVWCLIGGSTCCFVGLILMAVGRRTGVVNGNATHGIVIASIGLWLTDFGFNAADVAMRAIAVDALPKWAQPAANGAIAGAMGTGQVLGFVLGSLPMGRIIFGSGGEAGDFEGDVVVALVVILLTLASSVTALTSTAAAPASTASTASGGDFMNVFERQRHRRRMQQYRKAQRCARGNGHVHGHTFGNGGAHGVNGYVYGSSGHDGQNGHESTTTTGIHIHESVETNGNDVQSRLLASELDDETGIQQQQDEEQPSTPCTVSLLLSSFNLLRCPAQFYDIAVVTFFMWLGWFPFLYQCTDFVGSAIFGGDPAGSAHEEEVYARGVRFANLWLAANAVLVIISSRTLVPFAASRHGGYTLAFGAAVLASLLAVLAHLRYGARAATAVVLSLLGIPWAITGSQPFALLAMHCQSEAASLMGKLNICVVAPSFCVLLAMYCFTPLGVDARALILIGGGCAFVAVVCGIARLGKLR